MNRGQKKEVVGVVTGDKMDKTISVQVERLVQHPKFGKFMRKFTVFKAHDEKNEAKVGDKVQITETRPLSKTKRWRLVTILVRGGEKLDIPGTEALQPAARGGNKP